MSDIDNIKKALSDRFVGDMGRKLHSIAAPIAGLIRRDMFYVAGSSLIMDKPNDFDVYPVDNEQFDFDSVMTEMFKMTGVSLLHESKRCLTLSVNDKIVQLCNYSKPSLLELVKSFDFAHVQIGVEVKVCGGNGTFISDFQYTDDWLKSFIKQTTFYTGSDYPLSSLVRIHKYIERGCYKAKREWKTDTVKILKSIIERGYKDYVDFKDQLDAIDLALVDEVDSDGLCEFYTTCISRGLVKEC